MLLPQIYLDSIHKGRHNQPHSVLGMHFDQLRGVSGLRIGAFLQNVRACSVMAYEDSKCESFPMQKFSKEGYFEVFIPGREELFKYVLKITHLDGRIENRFDPYCFCPALSEMDLFLFNEGIHPRIYEKLGANLCEIDGIQGMSFGVWAPNAKQVSIVGDFNSWSSRYYPMRTLGTSGVWELFIPEFKRGFKYKYAIIDNNNNLHMKNDPYAIYYQEAPNFASIAYDIKNYIWHDEDWIKYRSKLDWKSQPISIYEVHLGSWRKVVEENERSLTYKEAAVELSTYVKEMGFTHIEFLPLSEHPFRGSWGYQVTGFYAPTALYGTPEEFMFLVDTMHQNNIGVIMDWVPGHFPKDNYALAQFDGTPIYEYSNLQKSEHPDWGTLIFNYGRNEVKNFLIGSALSWVERFHVDGLRVDGVASMIHLDFSRKKGEWIPNKFGGCENLEALDFLLSLNAAIHQSFPGILTIAEDSTTFSGMTKPIEKGGIGFDYKWNLGWMHDVLFYFNKNPIERKYFHNQLTFGMLYHYSENFMSVFSHDEVVHGKSSMIMKMGATSMSEKAQTLRALYTYMWMWPGKKTLFMGSEFGQSAEWNHDKSLDWHLLQYQDHKGIKDLVRDLNFFYRQHPSLSHCEESSEAFQWINPNAAENSTISFIRLGKKSLQETFLVVGNFSAELLRDYRIGIPYRGNWREVFNSNASRYGGNGVGNDIPILADCVACDDKDFSLKVTLPGLSVLIFQFDFN